MMLKALSWLTGDGALVLLVAGFLGAGAAVSYTATANYYKAKIARIESAQAAHDAQVAEAVLETQRQHFKQMEAALNVAQKQTIQARADADRANDANRRLRQSLADYRAKHANTTASTGQSEQDSDPIGVLTDLLGRMGEAGERISRYADEVKIAGAACEAAWPTHADSESK